MRIRAIIVATGLAVSAALPARAESPVVVELYTSQGCSSCPPADAYMQELARRDDVIALALHVDYWDYIGWKDIFARPENTRRQKAYAHVAGRGSVYTPQMIVGGTDHVVGTHPRDVARLIQKHKARRGSVEMSLRRKGSRVLISARAPRPVPGPLVVQMVRFKPHDSVAIKRGENAGRVLSYSNIVTDWRVIGEWDGDEALSLSAEAPGDQPVAIIVQRKSHGPIIAAARLP